MTRLCPHCGFEVPPKALACPECGSDSETGWASEEKRHRAAFSDFTEEDYRDVVRDLPGAPPGPLDIRRLLLAFVALIALVAFVLAFVV